jgi:hypothetical protein
MGSRRLEAAAYTRIAPGAQRSRTLVRTAFKVRLSPEATPGADASLRSELGHKPESASDLYPHAR